LQTACSGDALLAVEGNDGVGFPAGDKQPVCAWQVGDALWLAHALQACNDLSAAQIDDFDLVCAKCADE
jgi:hypothetical protein